MSQSRQLRPRIPQKPKIRAPLSPGAASREAVTTFADPSKSAASAVGLGVQDLAATVEDDGLTASVLTFRDLLMRSRQKRPAKAPVAPAWRLGNRSCAFSTNAWPADTFSSAYMSGLGFRFWGVGFTGNMNAGPTRRRGRPRPAIASPSTV